MDFKIPFYVFLGLPGAGKGTQAKLISQKLNLIHISTGDLFRENIKNQTPLGKQVSDILKNGGLVSDELTIALVQDRISKPDCQNGVILDGFPRTIPQASALDKLLNETNAVLKAVPYIKASEASLIARLTGRWTCKTCGQIYHAKTQPPVQVGICDTDGGGLIQRPDDQEEAIKKRVAEYTANTFPLVEYYRNTGLLIEINGEQDIAKVTSDLLDKLQ